MLSESDIIQVLQRLESLNYIRTKGKTGQWYQCYCPFHSNGQEKKPSCGVLLTEQYRNGQRYQAGLWHCFSCGAAKSFEEGITEVFKNHGVATLGAEWLKEFIPNYDNSQLSGDDLLPEGMIKELVDKYAADDLRLRLNAHSPKYVSEEELASYRYTVPYMYQRKLTDAVIEKYDVGFDGKFIPPGRSKPLPCVTFPVRDIQGRTLFFCRRSIEGKFFHYEEGVNKPVYGIYELPKYAKSVVVCESVFNCLTAVVYGYNAVALLGTGNPYQIEQLKRLGVHEFILCLDNDAAGLHGVKRLKAGLKDSAIVWVATCPEGKDVNDLTKEEFEEVIRNKE